MSDKKKEPKSKLKFSDLRDNYNNSKGGKSNSKKLKEKVEFPIDVFPKKIQDVMINWFEATQLPLDFFGLGILTVSGALIGNAYVLKYKNGYLVSPILYACVVGNPSIGKSPALDLVLKPLKSIEKQFQNEFLEEIDLWEIENDQVSKKEKSEKPKRKDIYLNDTTLEAVQFAHQFNQRGLICVYDELKGFMDNLNRYRSGGDISFWLSTWSGSTAKVNRATKETTYIEHPSISILGGIQPNVLRKMMGKDNRDNGFIYRFLFAYPENAKKPYDTDIEIDDLIDAEYHKIILDIFKLEDGLNGIDRIPISMTDEAKSLFVAWKNNLIDETNIADENSVKSLYGKLESYCLRFALILHVLESVSEKGLKSISGTVVSKATVEKSIKLTAYFKYTGLLVLDKIESNDPFDDLSENFINCYKALPEQFTTKVGIEIAEKFKIKKRTFQRRLSGNSRLFKNIKHGIYRKLL